MSFAATEYNTFKQALVYTVTVNAVNQVVDHRAGSLLTLVCTSALMTYGAQILQLTLAANQPAHKLLQPINRSATFIAETLVSVGVNMTSTLIGTYFSGLFNAVDPIFVLASSLVGLVLLWVLGVVVGAA